MKMFNIPNCDVFSDFAGKPDFLKRNRKYYKVIGSTILSVVSSKDTSEGHVIFREL
jgi:hypothetical protein